MNQLVLTAANLSVLYRIVNQISTRASVLNQLVLTAANLSNGARNIGRFPLCILEFLLNIRRQLTELLAALHEHLKERNGTEKG